MSTSRSSTAETAVKDVTSVSVMNSTGTQVRLGPGPTGDVNGPFSIGDAGRTARELPAGRAIGDGRYDIGISAVSAPGIEVRAATVRGLMHRRLDQPRQDAFALAHGPEAPEGPSPILAAAVCDGVGAYSRSQEAADFVAGELARAGAAGTDWPTAFARTNERLAELAGTNDARPNDGEPGGLAVQDPSAGGRVAQPLIEMATTAVAVRVEPVSSGWRICYGWIGNSSLWHMDPAGAWTELTGDVSGDESSAPLTSDPPSGNEEYHSTASRALPTLLPTWHTGDVALEGGVLIAVSDGVGDPLAWSGEQVSGQLASWWASPPDPFTFAAQVGFARRGHMDDRTALAIWLDSAALSADNRAAQTPTVPGGGQQTTAAP